MVLSLLAAVELMFVELVILCNQAGNPLLDQESFLAMVNSLIKGTEEGQKMIHYKKTLSLSCKSGSVCGAKYYCNFLERNEKRDASLVTAFP